MHGRICNVGKSLQGSLFLIAVFQPCLMGWYSVHQDKVAWNVAKETMSKEYKRWTPQEDFSALFLYPFFFSARVKLPWSSVWIVTAVIVAFTHHMRNGRCLWAGCPVVQSPRGRHHTCPQTIKLSGDGTLFPATTCPLHCFPVGESWLHGPEQFGSSFQELLWVSLWEPQLASFFWCFCWKATKCSFIHSLSSNLSPNS